MSGNNIEIERKYLLRSLPDLPWDETVDVTQGYLAINKDYHLRVRYVPSKPLYCHLDVKSNSPTLSRTEIEFSVNNSFAHHLTALAPYLIHKTRYQWKDWSVDVFKGQQLVLAEIEFNSLDAADPDMPKAIQDVLIREVTGEPEFYNVNIAQRINK